MSSFLKQRETGFVIVESCTLIFLNAVSLIGNALTCAAVYRNRHLRTSTNLHIVALAACDLCSAVLVMPFSSAVLIAGEWIFGDVLCNIQGFFVVLNIYASPCLMALTAFNRYIRIVRTNSYQRLFSMRKCQLWIGSVYATVTAYALTQVFVGNQKFQFVPQYAVCTTTHLRESAKVIHYSVIVPAFVICPIVTTTICYYSIFKTLRQHTKGLIPSLRSSSHVSLKISKRELRVSISLFVVVIVFAFCWMPLWVIALMFRFLGSLSRHVTLLIMFLVFVSSTVNPFIYAGMNGSFRNEFRRVCNCLLPSSEESITLQVRQCNEKNEVDETNTKIALQPAV